MKLQYFLFLIAVIGRVECTGDRTALRRRLATETTSQPPPEPVEGTTVLSWLGLSHVNESYDRITDKTPTTRNKEQVDNEEWFWQQRFLEEETSMDTRPPTRSPSSSPTTSPTVATPSPTVSTPSPTGAPTTATPVPTQTWEPSNSPTTKGTPIPSSSPTTSPAPTTTLEPSSRPSAMPSVTREPSATPTESPTTYSEAPSQAPSAFYTVLTIQEEAGVCNGGADGVGCAPGGGGGSSGNPNDIVNCYNVTNFGMVAPFFLDAVRFWVGENLDLPLDLSLRVWNGSQHLGPSSPDLPVFEQDLSNYVKGENYVNLTSPLLMQTDGVCVGVYAEDPNAGLRVRTETGEGDQSFIMAPTCGVNDFSSLEALGISGNFCIEAMVRDEQ